MTSHLEQHEPAGRPWVISRRTFLHIAAAAGLGTLSCAPGRMRIAGLRPVRFGMVTDCHYADVDTLGTRFYRESLDKLSECVTHMNAERVDFLVELGDLKDQDTPPVEDKTLTYLRKIEGVFRQFQGPTYHVLGNHDVDSLSKGQFLSCVENTGIDPGRSYYSFDVNDLHFIVLDANYAADGTDYNHGNFSWRGANVAPREIDWLRQDLASCGRPTIVFIHQLLGGVGPVSVKNAAEVRRVLESSGRVLAVFQGHHHEGGYVRINGIHYYTLKAVVEGHGEENNSYAIVDVHPDRGLIVTGYRKAVSRGLVHVSVSQAKPSPSGG
jgi:hypothetical protein